MNNLKTVAPISSRKNSTKLEDETMSLEEYSPATTTSRKKSRTEVESMSLEENSPVTTKSRKKSRTEDKAMSLEEYSPATTKSRKKSRTEDCGRCSLRKAENWKSVCVETVNFLWSYRMEEPKNLRDAWKQIHEVLLLMNVICDNNLSRTSRTSKLKNNEWRLL
jgi:hypothetical protein